MANETFQWLQDTHLFLYENLGNALDAANRTEKRAKVDKPIGRDCVGLRGRRPELGVHLARRAVVRQTLLYRLYFCRRLLYNTLAYQGD